MPKTTAFLEALEDLVFNNVNLAHVGDATGLQGSSTVGVFWLSLHTGSPGVGGTQATNEAAYAGYARVSVARTSSGWVRTGGSYSPVATVAFPVATGGSETETFAGIGTDASGAGNLLYFGAISPTIVVTTGVVPELTTASTVTES